LEYFDDRSLANRYRCRFCGCSISWPNIAPAEWNPQTKRHVHVYLLRGFTDAFSQGIYDLANTIRNQGIDVSIHNKFEWPFLADQAVRNHAEGREGSTIVIGYSLGTDAATLMADRLAQAGMPPNLVVTLDPVASIIDGEVVRVVNLCIINGAGIPLARGQSVGEQFLKLELRNRADIRRASQNTPPTLDQLILFHVLGAAAQERSRTIPENAETSTASAKRYLKAFANHWATITLQDRENELLVCPILVPVGGTVHPRGNPMLWTVGRSKLDRMA
jgi:pimeloyl-ACP methyl ester carboxylesterase